MSFSRGGDPNNKDYNNLGFRLCWGPSVLGNHHIVPVIYGDVYYTYIYIYIHIVVFFLERGWWGVVGVGGKGVLLEGGGGSNNAKLNGKQMETENLEGYIESRNRAWSGTRSHIVTENHMEQRIENQRDAGNP